MSDSVALGAELVEVDLVGTLQGQQQWELRSPEASQTDLKLVRSAINNQKITSLCGPIGDHKRP